MVFMKFTIAAFVHLQMAHINFLQYWQGSFEEQLL